MRRAAGPRLDATDLGIVTRHTGQRRLSTANAETPRRMPRTLSTRAGPPRLATPNSPPPRYLLGFAAPTYPLDPSLCDAIVGEYSKGYLSLFLDRHKYRLIRASRDLIPVLQAWLGTDASFRAAWDPAFADIRRAALWPRRFRALDVAHAAAAAGLRILADGHRARFDVALDPSVRLRLDRVVLPGGDHLAAEARGRAIELHVGTGRRRKTVLLEKRRGHWTANGAEELPAVQVDREFCVLLAPPVWPTAYGASEAHTSPAMPPEEIVRATRGAIGVLRRHSPRYVPWVDRVLRAIIPCAGSQSHLRSGSDFDLPGVIQVSYPAHPAALAEMMVHECSHLTFQIVTRLGEVDDGTDETLYYSPVKQTGRPIDRILLAYHAFANLVLFYRTCLASGIDDDGYCERNEQATIPQLEMLDEALCKTTALTPIGRALFEPLRDLIR